MEAWVTIGDLRASLNDTYHATIAQGHGHDAAVAKAAALLAMHRDQLAHPSVAVGLTNLILNSADKRIAK